jgi:flagellar motor switch protein FliN
MSTDEGLRLVPDDDPIPPPPERPGEDAGPLGLLPRLASRQVHLGALLARAFPEGTSPVGRAGLDDLIGAVVEVGRPDVLWRASGLGRPALVAQMSWTRLATRLALAIETPVAHAVVDRMLGFERFDEEARLQLTPVEWGILTFVLARALGHLAAGPGPGPLGPWDLVLDRVGPDPFDPTGLGPIVTLLWPVRVGAVSGSARLWLPEPLVARRLAAEPPAPAPSVASALDRLGDLDGSWRAEAGTVAMPRGLGRLRVGGVLPLSGSRLGGTPQSPTGPVDLAPALPVRGGRLRFPAEPVPYSGGGRITLTAPLHREPSPREAIAVSPSPDPDRAPGPDPATAGVDPADVPVTLVVELGRVNLSLRRLADLRPGDVVELGRHSREPVELTSGGRLVARGELVLIDTELGVRVTSVFL